MRPIRCRWRVCKEKNKLQSGKDSCREKRKSERVGETWSYLSYFGSDRGALDHFACRSNFLYGGRKWRWNEGEGVKNAEKHLAGVCWEMRLRKFSLSRPCFSASFPIDAARERYKVNLSLFFGSFRKLAVSGKWRNRWQWIFFDDITNRESSWGRRGRARWGGSVEGEIFNRNFQRIWSECNESLFFYQSTKVPRQRGGSIVEKGTWKVESGKIKN